MDNQAQTRARRGGGPFQHLEITIGVTERGNGAAADMLPDSDGFILLVIETADFRLADNDGVAVDDFIASLDAAADDLLGRYPINLLGPAPP